MMVAVSKSNSSLIVAMIPLAISAVLLVVYAEVGEYSFLRWDDQAYVIDNPHLGDVSHFWASPFEGYIPLTYTLWSLVYQLFGRSPCAFHRFNLLLHMLNAGLVFAVLQTLFRWRQFGHRSAKGKPRARAQGKSESSSSATAHRQMTMRPCAGRCVLTRLAPHSAIQSPPSSTRQTVRSMYEW